MPKKTERKTQGTGEKKLREQRKTISQLKAQIRQLRKALTLAEERVIQLQDAQGDQEVVETARKIARGKRKRLDNCEKCGILAIEEQVTDLGARYMVVKICNNCGFHQSTEFKKKD